MSSLPHGLHSSTVLSGGAMKGSIDHTNSCQSSKANKEGVSGDNRGFNGVLLDDFSKLLIQDDARQLIDLLKLAVTGT